MQTIQGILFEPVGCLAEFPPGPFHEIAARLFGGRKKTGKSASRSYWHLLNLIEAADRPISEEENNLIQTLELQAVEESNVYEDVIPALTALTAMGIPLAIASSLSSAAVERFIDKAALGRVVSATATRDTTAGVKAAPLRGGLSACSLEPARAMFLTDTAEGLRVANAIGINSILMMNDPDESRRLAAHGPSGGIVSLHELPDFIRFVAEKTHASG